MLGFTLRHVRDRAREAYFQTLWREAFSQPRKTLSSNLRSRFPIEFLETWLSSRGYDTTVRSERLSLADWEDLLAHDPRGAISEG